MNYKHVYLCKPAVSILVYLKYGIRIEVKKQCFGIQLKGNIRRKTYPNLTNVYFVLLKKIF